MGTLFDFAPRFVYDSKQRRGSGWGPVAPAVFKTVGATHSAWRGGFDSHALPWGGVGARHSQRVVRG